LAAGEPTNRRNRWCVGGLGAFAGNDQRGTRFLWLAHRFLIGAITLPFGLWIRTGLPETLHRRETGTVMVQAVGNSFGPIRANARVMILGLLILASGTIITYVTEYMTTYAENTLHVATDLAFATIVASNGLGIVAALYGGWLADRAGRWLAAALAMPPCAPSSRP
jgi:predicted MFS family arabinose efflux permease